MQNEGTIVLVEDAFIRNYLKFLLVRRGYTVVEADARRACDLIQSQSGTVVITNTPDPFLPFADHISLLYLAAAPDLALASRFPACRVLRKPFQPDELLETVGALVPIV